VAKVSIEFNLFCILATNCGVQDVKVVIQCRLLNYYRSNNKTVYLETKTYYFVSLQVSVFHWQLCWRVRSCNAVSTMNYHCEIFDVLLTVHLSIFISVINQLDAQNFCFTISLFHASTCLEHLCLSLGGQNCITQPVVSSHL